MIINLTQHKPTPEQVLAGVGESLAGAADLMTFTSPPSPHEIWKRAAALAHLAREEADRLYADLGAGGGSGNWPIWPGPAAMVGGAPYLMGPLCESLRGVGITPLFSFSERVSEEVPLADGGVRKVATFRHIGWVNAPAEGCSPHYLRHVPSNY